MNSDNQEMLDNSSQEDDKVKILQKEKRALAVENRNLRKELEQYQKKSGMLEYLLGYSLDEKDKCILIMNDKLDAVIAMLENNVNHEEILNAIKSESDFSAAHYCYEKGVSDRGDM